jgi:hypothetical protein
MGKCFSKQNRINTTPYNPMDTNNTTISDDITLPLPPNILNFNNSYQNMANETINQVLGSHGIEVDNIPAEIQDQLGSRPTVGDGPDTEETRQRNLMLQDIIEGIYDATMKAQSSVQLNNLNNLFWMFPKDENGVHAPRTVKMLIDENTSINIPIFTLLNHKNLCIHELRLKTTVDLHMDDKPMMQLNKEVNQLKKKKYKVGVKTNVKKERGTTIEICMKIEEPPEIYGRILQNLEKNL